MSLDLKDENSEDIFHNNINILNRLANPINRSPAGYSPGGHKESDLTKHTQKFH